MSGYGPQPVAQYTISRGLFHKAWDVINNGQTIYHVDNSHWTPGKPDLTFHAGASTTGPIAGVCKYRHFSSDTEIGLGDPAQAHAIEWFCLNRDSMMSVRYSFRMRIGSDHQARTFTWKRTRSCGSRHGSLKLVDESDRVLAVLSSGGILTSRSTSGQMDIYVQYGDRFQLMVLMSGLALREKLARARAAAASAGGGGGGA